MCRHVQAIALALLAGSLLSCKDNGGTGPAQPPPRELTSIEKSIVAADNSFSFMLLGGVNKEEQGKNLFISPFSVSMALGMTLNGASGTTRTTMQQTLGFAGLSEPDINQSYKTIIPYLKDLDPTLIFQVANSIWYRPTLMVEQDFIRVNKDSFGAEVNSIDFSNQGAPRTINDWVNRNTQGKIASIVPDPIPREIVMYLINAIYFKGTWKYQFDKKLTTDDVFTVPNGSTTPCKMMVQEGTFQYFNNSAVQGVDLPYGDAGFSMTILLPSPGSSVDGLFERLTQQQWGAWISTLVPQAGTVFLPKFKIEYEKKLNDVLKGLGMGIAFSDLADFTRIDKRGALAISEVRHKTYVEVDEEGTEAAAVTSVGIGTTSFGGTFVMRIDRPFVFVIRESHSETILFMGKVVNPGL